MKNIALRVATSVLALLFTAVVAAQTVPSVSAFLATAPSEPIAGEPFDVVIGFEYASGAGPWTGPVVEVEGSTISVFLGSACEANGIACDVFSSASVAASMPALAPGSYTLRLYRDRDASSPLLRELGLEVAAADSAPETVQPQPGYWYAQDRPGTGFALDLKGGVVALTRFDFSEPPESSRLWSQLAASLRRDAVVGVESAFFGGSCLDCDYVAPVSKLVEAGIRLRFESARRAWLEQGGREPVALVQVPFGADYAPVALSDPADADFGPLPLPDLAGTWLLVGPVGFPEDSATVLQVVRDPLEEGAEAVRYTARESPGAIGFSIDCTGGDAERSADCTLSGFDGVMPLGRADLGDVIENRVRFISGDADASEVHQMFRLRSASGAPGG